MLATASDPGEQKTWVSPSSCRVLIGEIVFAKLFRMKNDKICDIVYSSSFLDDNFKAKVDIYEIMR